MGLGIAAASLGCARPPAWPHSGVVVVGIGPEPPDREHFCTGTVVSSTAATKIVLTARHCIADAPGPRRSTLLSISYPSSDPERNGWKTVRARVLAMPERAAPEPDAVGPWTWLDTDWALLRVDTADALDAIPLLDGDPTRLIPSGDRLDLVSCFDTGEPGLRCHAHTFAFGDRPKALVEGGHSGAPILWRGRLVATFSGGRPDWFLFFRRLWWLRTLDVESVAPVRAALLGHGIGFGPPAVR